MALTNHFSFPKWLLSFLIDGGSEISFIPGDPSQVLIDDKSSELRAHDFDESSIIDWVSGNISESKKAFLDDRLDFDFFYQVPGTVSCFHGSLVFEEGRPCLKFRSLPKAIPEFSTYSDLSEDEVSRLNDVFFGAFGLLIVWGRTHKQTQQMLASLVDYLNRRFFFRITSIEHPVNYVQANLGNSGALIQQIGITEDGPTSADILPQIGRQSPDVLAIDSLTSSDAVMGVLRQVESGSISIAGISGQTPSRALEDVLNHFSDIERPMIRAMISERASQVLVPKSIGMKLLDTSSVANSILHGDLRSLDDLV